MPILAESPTSYLQPPRLLQTPLLLLLPDVVPDGEEEHGVGEDVVGVRALGRDARKVLVRRVELHAQAHLFCFFGVFWFVGVLLCVGCVGVVDW